MNTVAYKIICEQYILIKRPLRNKQNVLKPFERQSSFFH